MIKKKLTCPNLTRQGPTIEPDWKTRHDRTRQDTPLSNSPKFKKIGLVKFCRKISVAYLLFLRKHAQSIRRKASNIALRLCLKKLKDRV